MEMDQSSISPKGKVDKPIGGNEYFGCGFGFCNVFLKRVVQTEEGL